VPGSCISFATGPFPPYTPAGAVHSAINQDNVSWRTGVNWKVLPETLVYFNVSKGYKAGDFSTQPIVFASQVVSVSQESLLAYEVGFKSTLAAGALQVNGAAFYYDYDNKQIDGYVTIPIFGNFPALVNVPKSSIRGGEMDVAWKPIAALRLSANGTYLSSRVDSTYIGGTPVPSVSTDFEGEALPNTPRWLLNADAEYSFRVTDRLTGHVGASEFFRSSAYALFGQTPGFDIPSYALLDLRAGITSASGWGVELFGHNVTNRYYLTNVAHEIDTVTRYTGMPVTYGIKFSYRY
jgi:iron complex outermembrane recepter protein